MVLIAAFLRFYQLSLTEFDTDQAVLWNMAHVAISHGLIPTTANQLSTGIVDPPAYIYFMMVADIFSSNPLAGAILTSFLNVVAVILTYAFTRRYFGRLAGFVAASLTATAVLMISYSRFIWQPNILAPLLLLYMMALFYGAVERRTGWLAPALLLLGLTLHLSGSSVYLVPALLVALVLGYKTLRWRDLALGVVLFVLAFLTYAVWEVATGYPDVSLLLSILSKHAAIDSQAVRDYLGFLSSYTVRPTNGNLFFTRIFPLMYLHRLAMLGLIGASFVLVILGLFWKRVQLMADGATEPYVPITMQVSANTTFWRRLWLRWNVFIDSPQRRGILLLLAWQLLPLMLLSRHAISLQVHYFLILMPGPFILIGLLVSQAYTWSASMLKQGKLKGLRYVVLVLAVLLILVQTLGSLTWLLDNTNGNQSIATKYNSLQDLQAAIQATDQVAQERHFRHVYIDTDTRTTEALNYLAQPMKTAHTLINSNSSHCLLLPDMSQGPAVMLFGPTQKLDEVLLTQVASATLVGEPSRLGGAPFHIYIVQPFVTASSAGATNATGLLTLDQKPPMSLIWQNPDTPDQPAQHLLATFWSNQALRPADDSSWYTYHFVAGYRGQGTDGQSGAANCLLSNLVPGEHLLVPFSLSAGTSGLPTSLVVSGTIASSTPYILNYGSLRFQTLRQRSAVLARFQRTIGVGQG